MAADCVRAKNASQQLLEINRLKSEFIVNAGREIDVSFMAELDTKQGVAVSALLAHDDGVLVAPPGSGKTVMACAVIAER